jgi:hypothetical protein
LGKARARITKRAGDDLVFNVISLAVDGLFSVVSTLENLTDKGLEKDFDGYDF